MVFEEEAVGRDVDDARGADILDGGFESAVAGVERGLQPDWRRSLSIAVTSA